MSAPCFTTARTDGSIRSGPAILAFVFAATSAVATHAAESRSVLRPEITPQLELSVRRGLEHLVRSEGQSGRFDSAYPVAANALAGLAFLAAGYDLDTGPEHTVSALRRGTQMLLDKLQTPSGYFYDGESHMYGHGFATLYLAELYGTSPRLDRRLRRALRAAVAVIEGSQSADGGWDYEPAPRFFAEGTRNTESDTSITVCQTMALRAARNLGLEVSETTIARARAYIYRAQNSDGGFCYRQGSYGGSFPGSSFPRSAAGVCILYSLGDYNSPKIRLGFDYLFDNYRFPWSNKFPYYAHYYCAQAMFQAGGKYWREYFPWVSRALQGEQRSDGSWGARGLENSTQATAMALIVLQLPYRFLPIHER